MKLHEILLNPKKDKKNYTTLIVNLQSITFFELGKMYSILDNKDFLSNKVRDWYPIHYAALNSDFRVLENIIKLYQKHNLSLDVITEDHKNSIPNHSNIMDISYIKENFANIMITYKYNLTPHHLFKNGIVGLTSRYDDIKENEINILMNLPYKQNIITPIIYYNYDFHSILNTFMSVDFEEKELFINEFKENLNYLYETALNINEIKVIDALNRKLEYLGEKYSNYNDKHHIIDILFIPFYRNFDFLMKSNDNEIIEMINSKKIPKAFEYSIQRPIFSFLKENNLADVLSHLDAQQFNNFSNKFINYYNKFKPIMTALGKDNAIAFFDSLYPIIFSANLNNSLCEKQKHINRGKI